MEQPENLARDLHLYLPGLSSVLSFASLSVRPYLLSLLEDHILHIEPSALRPAIKSIILSLLPGLEDETSEDFERVVQVLDKFRAVSEEKLNDTQENEAGDTRDSYFWQCFFLATITSPSRRQGSLAFLVRHLPKFATKGTSKDGLSDKALQSLPTTAQAALSPEPGLLIRCFAAGLSDHQLLVQRGFLDLLVTHLPLDSAVLQQAVPKADLDRIVFAAAGVVSRRDMSLNRRLWAWFLGPEPNGILEKTEDNTPLGVKSPTVDLSSHHAAYFARYGLQSLTRSILSLLHRKEGSPTERARPFRICLSLMDRWEVGGLLIPDIFIPAVQNVFEYSQSASKSDVDDVVKSASIFFDGVESGLIWAKIFELLQKALKLSTASESERASNLQLCLFVIQRFNLREEEMLVYHMPLTTLATVSLLNDSDARSPSKYHSTRVEHLALDVAERIANMIPQRAFTTNTTSHVNSDTARTLPTGKEVLSLINRFYVEDHGTFDGTSPPLSSAIVGHQLLRQSIALFLSSLGPSRLSGGIETTTRLLCILLQKVPGVKSVLRDVDLQSSLQSTLIVDESEKFELQFPVVSAMTMLLATTQSVTAEDPYIATPDLLKIQHALVRLLWDYLSPFSPKYHVEAVRCLWQLEGSSPSSRYVEASITDLLASSLRHTAGTQAASSTDGARHFAVLWTHSMQEKSSHGGEKGQRGMIRRISSSTGLNSAAGFPADPSAMLARPLFVVLDSLAEEGTELFDYAKVWIQQLSTLPRLFDILLSQIRALRCFQLPVQEKRSRKVTNASLTSDDTEECLYYMRHLLRITKHASEHTWLVLAGDMVDPLLPQGKQEHDQIALQSLLIEICMRSLEVASSTHSVGPHLGDLERTSLEVMLLLVQSPFSAPLKDLELEKPLLDILQLRLPTMEPLLQTSLLSTITAILKLRFHSMPHPRLPHQRKFSKDITPSASRTSISEKPASGISPLNLLTPPPSLIECLRAGFSLPSSRVVLESWVAFLVEVLPLFSATIFQNLIPLVECFCTQMGLVFEQLRSTFLHKQAAPSSLPSPEPTLISLMNGLEQILARAHDRLVTEESNASSTKSPDQPQGFFGNMVQGVFANETEKPTRTSTANNRLAVLLCFQDTVRSCFTIWSWGVYGHGNEKQDAGSIASFGYTALRMRNRARRLLEHLFAAEALESLETLAVFFCRPPSPDFQKSSVMGLLNVLNGSRPRHTIPAIFNAIYSRTNPTALDFGKMSSLTSELSDTELVGFLVEYMNSIEDDAMDEIWADCMAFVKDVLANPLPHSQILPLLLDFVALIAEKVDNTNFGEQRKMRKELGVSRADVLNFAKPIANAFNRMFSCECLLLHLQPDR